MSRNLSSLAKLSKKSSFKSEPWKSILLKNGINVLSRDDQSPMCRLAISYSAGPRFEKHNQKGMSHFLSLLVDQSKSKCSSLNFVRTIQQKGVVLGCGVTRESVYYYLDCSRDYLDSMSPYLVLAAVHPVFKPWEVEDMKQTLADRIRNYQTDETSVVFEKLHEAAFRRGLGNSLYASPYMVENMNSQSMSEFFKESCVIGRTSVVGVGVPADDLERFARLLDIGSGKGDEQRPTSFYGSELRVPSASSEGRVAVVVKGVCLGDNDYICSNIAKIMLGDDFGVTECGYSLSSRLNSAAMVKLSRSPRKCKGVSFSYSDGGLLGYYVRGSAEDMNQLVMNCHVEFLSILDGKVSEEEFNRAKNQYKSLLGRQDCGYAGKFQRVLPFVGVGLPVTELGDVWRRIDSVELGEFKNFLKRRERVFAMSAVGGVDNVPYLDELPTN